MSSRHSLLFAAFSSALACSGPQELPVEIRKLSEAQRAVYRSVESGQTELGDAHAAAVEVAEGLDEYEVQLRYNPASCECPDFEVRIHERWERAFLDATPETIEQLRSLAGNAKAETTWSIRGRPADERRRTETGVAFAVFEVTSR